MHLHGIVNTERCCRTTYAAAGPSPFKLFYWDLWRGTAGAHRDGLESLLR